MCVLNIITNVIKKNENIFIFNLLVLEIQNSKYKHIETILHL